MVSQNAIFYVHVCIFKPNHIRQVKEIIIILIRNPLTLSCRAVYTSIQHVGLYVTQQNNQKIVKKLDASPFVFPRPCSPVLYPRLWTSWEDGSVMAACTTKPSVSSRSTFSNRWNAQNIDIFCQFYFWRSIHSIVKTVGADWRSSHIVRSSSQSLKILSAIVRTIALS